MLERGGSVGATLLAELLGVAGGEQPRSFSGGWWGPRVSGATVAFRGRGSGAPPVAAAFRGASVWEVMLQNPGRAEREASALGTARGMCFRNARQKKKRRPWLI